MQREIPVIKQESIYMLYMNQGGNAGKSSVPIIGTRAFFIFLKEEK